MGTADTFGKAYQKAQMAVGKAIPLEGTAVVDLSESEFPSPESEAGEDLVAGYAEHFELVEFESTEAFVEAIENGEIDLIVSRQRDPLETAVEEEVTYFSTLPSAKAALEAIEAADEPIDVQPVDARHKRDEYWGQPKED
jgi:carbamoyl-phosphate synthase large subunit